MSQFKLSRDEARKLWVEALRSGEYKQCRRFMRHNGGHCCLDVARIVMERAEGVTHSLHNSEDKTLCSFPDVQDWLGLERHNGGFMSGSGCDGKQFLSALNDDGTPFAEIAAIIESAPPGLFVEETVPPSTGL